MATPSERTHDLFVAATLSNDDLGYPNGVEFVPDEEPWTDEVVWRNLLDGRPTLLVGRESELLLVSRRRGVLDGVRKRVPVRVAFRVDGRPGEFAVECHIGRYPVREMRERALR